MYRAGEVSVHRACCERATQPYSLGGGGTIYSGSRPADVTTRSPRMIAECLLTRSMLIKMYYHFMVCACIYMYNCIYSQSISYLVYLVFQVAFQRNDTCPTVIPRICACVKQVLIGWNLIFGYKVQRQQIHRRVERFSTNQTLGDILYPGRVGWMTVGYVYM